MEWVRGRKLGSGAFATVYLAGKTDNSDLFPPFMAVKSSPFSFSQSLRHEREVLRRLDSCPEIIRCFGDNITIQRGEKLYNLVLEYASGGSLVDQLDKYGGRLPESLVRRCTRGILKGLDFIHSKGFVHCDIKLGNILVVDNGDVKIADFGLAKMAGEEILTEGGNFELRGTPLSIAPESVTDNEYNSPCDIWALACAVVEMFTGKPAWNLSKNLNICAVIMRTSVGMELPVIPTDLSDEGKDFLDKCFVKDHTKRWSAQMLLDHPFVANDPAVPSKQPVESSPSPKSPFELLHWASHSFLEILMESDRQLETELNLCLASPADRLRQLTTADAASDWLVSEGWVSIR